MLKIPTGRRQTNRLFTKRDQGFELGTTEKHPDSGRMKALYLLGPPDYKTSALNLLATLPPSYDNRNCVWFNFQVNLAGKRS